MQEPEDCEIHCQSLRLVTKSLTGGNAAVRNTLCRKDACQDKIARCSKNPVPSQEEHDSPARYRSKL